MDGFFTASVTTGRRPGTTIQPLDVRVQEVTARRPRSSGTPIPFVGPNDPAPSAPQVWLQLWEIDTFETRGHRSRPRRDDGAEEPPPDHNDFLCAIPGFVKQTAEHAFQFRVLPTQAITWGSGDPLGWLSVKLKTPSGADWVRDGRNLVVPIRGEAEDEVDVGAALTTSASARDHESQWQGGAICHLTNLTHMLGSQLEEGGLTLAFYADLLTDEERADLAAARRHIREQHLEGEARTRYMRDAMTRSGRLIWNEGDVDCPGNNDTFRSVGEAFERSHHPIGLHTSGVLFPDTTPMRAGTDDVTRTITQVVERVNQEFVQAFGLNEGRPAKVRHLLFFTHGWSTGIRTGRGQELNNRGIGRFVEQVAPHLGDDVLVSLMACSTASGDETFGAVAAPGHRYPGEGTFADRLCRALIAAGRSNAAVWGHTTAGHTTGNPYLRAFAAAGGADAVWFTTSPPASSAERARLAGQFISDHRTSGPDGDLHARQNFRLARGHPGDRVQRVMSG